ncbi:MAG: hypothetical protein ABIV43_00230 [Candidatus Saccharimonadales bacterium]
MRALSQPVAGKNSDIDVPYTISKPKNLAQPSVTVTNDYFVLPLPTGYRQNSSQTDAADARYTTRLVKPSTSGSLLVTIAIVDTPPGGMQQLTTYRSRSQSPQLYTVTNQFVGDQQVTAFERRDGAAGEAVVYWPHGSVVATIAVTTSLQSADDSAANREVLLTLLEGWRWQ